MAVNRSGVIFPFRAGVVDVDRVMTPESVLVVVI